MLHSGHVAAKLLSGNELKTHKVHFVGAVGHEVSPMLWSIPQIYLSSLLNLEAHDKLIGTGMAGPPTRTLSPLPQLAWSWEKTN